MCLALRLLFLLYMVTTLPVILVSIPPGRVELDGLVRLVYRFIPHAPSWSGSRMLDTLETGKLSSNIGSEHRALSRYCQPLNPQLCRSTSTCEMIMRQDRLGRCPCPNRGARCTPPRGNPHSFWQLFPGAKPVHNPRFRAAATQSLGRRTHMNEEVRVLDAGLRGGATQKGSSWGSYRSLGVVWVS